MKLTFFSRGGTIAGLPDLGAKAMKMEVRPRAAKIILRFVCRPSTIETQTNSIVPTKRSMAQRVMNAFSP